MSLTTGTQNIKTIAANAADKPGIYQMQDEAGETLYIGKAKSLKKRLLQYTQVNRLAYRIQQMVARVAAIELTLTKTEIDALLLEANLVKNIQPPYNILLKDDKSFPYIHIDETPYPRISKYRGTAKKDGFFFGPYPSAHAVNQAITDIQKAFGLRPCTDSFFKSRSRACIEYQIKRCLGPCVGHVRQEHYQHAVEDAKQILKGKNRHIQETLATKMQQASKDLNYEKAAEYRDRIKALNHIQSKHLAHMADQSSYDVIACYRVGHKTVMTLLFFRGGKQLGHKNYIVTNPLEAEEEEIVTQFLTQFYQNHPPAEQLILSTDILNTHIIEQALSTHAKHRVSMHIPKRGDKYELIRNALENARDFWQQKQKTEENIQQLHQELQTTFHLPTLPKRIEVYDNSHMMGAHDLGAMIVAGPDGFEKPAYRRFYMKGLEQQSGDDYAYLKETLRRRFKQGSASEVLPDLIFIDGGINHLHTAHEIMDEKGLSAIPLIAIAKGKERNKGQEVFHQKGKPPFSFKKDDPLLHYIQNMRDEAHNTAIGAHRKRRNKALTHSKLEDIPGIGASRKKALLLHFGSLKTIQTATIEEIAKVEGINKALAEQIKQSLR